jgi:hypothetical protein
MRQRPVCIPKEDFLVGSEGKEPLRVGLAGASLNADLQCATCMFAGGDLKARIESIGSAPGVGNLVVSGGDIADGSVSLERFRTPLPLAMGGTNAASLNPMGVALWSATQPGVRTDGAFLVSPSGDLLVPSLRLPDGSKLARGGSGQGSLGLFDAAGAPVKMFDGALLGGERPTVTLADSGGDVLWTVVDPNGDALEILLRFYSFPPNAVPTAADVAQAPHYQLLVHPGGAAAGTVTVNGAAAKPGGNFYVAAVARDPSGYSETAELTYF